MNTSDKSRTILRGLSVFSFAIICLSFVESLVWRISIFHIFHLHLSSFVDFAFIVLSLGIIFLLIKKASFDKFRIWVILLAIVSTINTCDPLILFLDKNI